LESQGAIHATQNNDRTELVISNRKKPNARLRNFLTVRSAKPS
jgi:hypothetical protein